MQARKAKPSRQARDYKQARRKTKASKHHPQTKQARNQARDSKHDPALSTGNRFRVGCSWLVMTHTTCAAPGSPEFFFTGVNPQFSSFCSSIFFSFSSSVFFYFFCINFPSLIVFYMTFLYFCFKYLHFCLFYIISYRFLFLFLFFFGGGGFFFCWFVVSKRV